MARSKRQVSTRGARGSGRARSAARGVRRVWPYVLMAWERWQSLSPEEKERYKKQARGYMDRGRKALEAQRRRRPPRR
jgi:ferric-dicitrate binding protein FerR (iron transport regulator)